MSDSKSYHELSQQYSNKINPEIANDLLYRKGGVEYWVKLLTENFVIKDKEGKVRLMSPLKLPQLKLLKLWQYMVEEKWPIRLICLKSRKTGVSSLSQALCLLRSMGYDGEGKDSLTVAHDRSTSEYLFKLCQRYLDHFKLNKPEVVQSSVRQLTFDDKGKTTLSVGTANDENCARGQTPQSMHLSECAFWFDGRATFTSLAQSISDSPSTAIIIESTANSYDNLMFPLWTNAEKYCQVDWHEKDGDVVPEVNVSDWDNWNGFIPYFISWADDIDNIREFRSDEDRQRFISTMNEQEKRLNEEYKVNYEQLHWYRRCLQDRCQGDEKIRRQEYPSFPSDAFVSSSRNFLEHEDIMKVSQIETGRRGYLVQNERWGKQISFVEDSTQELIIYRDPNIHGNHRYCIGVDVASGEIKQPSGDSDKSAAVVLDIDDGCRTVAAFYSNSLTEEPFAEIIELLGKYYCSRSGDPAFIIVESAGYGAHTIIHLRSNYDTAWLYRRTDFLSDRKRSKQIGWKTSISSRPILLGDLKSSIGSSDVIIHDRELQRELQELSYNKRGKVEGMKHDDIVFALGLAIQGVKAYPMSMSKNTSGLKPLADRAGDDSIDPVTGY
jgi:hypothetical protein